MTVNIEIECALEGIFDFDVKELTLQVFEAVLDEELCPYEAQVSVLLTGDEQVRRANMQFRGIDSTTDVLSFPSADFEEPSGYDSLDDSNFDLDSGELLLGDIMISVPRVVSQSEEYGHSTKREYAFLVAHSTLHLLGYDHAEPDDEKIMYSKQDKILDMLDIRRDGRI